MKHLLLLFLLATPTLANELLFPFVLPWDDASTNITSLTSWSAPIQPVRISAAGHFEAGGQRLRFLGVNLAFGACLPQPEHAPKIAARLARFGINIVRFHHLDSQPYPNGLLAEGGGVHPAALARLDHFIAELQKQGIYANLNLLVGRRFRSAEGLPAALDELDWKDRALVGFYSSRLIELQKQYARQLLTHTNALTGRTYAADPGVATVEIHNENGLLHGWLGGRLDRWPESLTRELQLQWNVWLRRHYGRTAKLRSAWNTQVQPPGEELITLDPDRWILERRFRTQASAAITNQIIELNIHKPGQADWHVQYTRPGLVLRADQPYTLRFRAKADTARSLVIALGQAYPPWADLGLRSTVNLSTNWQPFEFSFTATADDPQARLLFGGLGLVTGQVWISELSLRRGGITGLGDQERLETGSVSILRRDQIGGRTDPAQRDWHRFLWETEDRYWQEFKLFLKQDLQVQAPIIGTIVGCSTPNLMARLDAIDTHGYWQHPRFPDKPWDQENWLLENKSMVAEPRGGILPSLALQRVAGKPHCVTEYNHPAPNTFSAEALPLLAAYAALQDWDAIYLYNYAQRRDDWAASRIAGFFDSDQHPLKMASLIPAAALFRRADVQPARQLVLLPLDKQRELDLLRRARPWNLIDARHFRVPPELALVYRVALATTKGSAPPLPVIDVLRSDTGELNWQPGLVTINTPRSKAVIGYGAGKRLELGTLTIEPGPTRQDGWSVITATELAPGRWLVTALGDIENTNMGWKDPAKSSVGRDWGQAPTLVEGVSARLDFGRPFQAWTLDERGQRRQLLPATPVLELGPQHQTIWYEVELAH